MDAWAPVVQTLAWITFLSVLLIVGRTKVGAVADAVRTRIAEGAAIKATAPGGLSLELSERNAPLTPVAPAGTRSGDTARAVPPSWTSQREVLGRTQRGIHIAHTIAPSTKPGQEFDLYVYLVGWSRERFKKPNDLADVARAEFYLGPAWGDAVIEVLGGEPRIGFRTAAYAPALCLCRITFDDGETVILSRYLDFEMGYALGATAWGE